MKKDKIINKIVVFIKIINSESKLYFLLVFLHAICISIPQVANIYFTKVFLDLIIKKVEYQKIIITIITFLLFKLCCKLLELLFSRLLQKNNILIEQKIRHNIIQKTMNLDYTSIESTDTINLRETINQSINSGYNITLICNSINSFISNVLVVISVLYIFILFDIFYLGLIILVIFLIFMIQRAIRKNSYVNFERWIPVNKNFGYIFRTMSDFKNAKDIRLYNVSPLLNNIADKYTDKIVSFCREENGVKFKLGVYYYLVYAFQQIVAYGFLTYKFLQNTITLSAFSMYISAVFTFVNSIDEITKNLLNIHETTKHMERYIEYLNMPQPPKEHQTKPIPMNWNTIRFENVSFKYPNRKEFAVQNINIEIEKNKRYTIVGQNGSGKTTFIKLLMGLYQPTEGAIYVDDINVESLSREKYMAFFTTIFQDFSIYALTISDNITLSDEQKSEVINDVIHKVDLHERIYKMDHNIMTYIYRFYHEDGIELSGGESQKLAIARALYRSSDISILDEPTAAVDPISEYDILQRFNHAVTDSTSIIVSHRMSSCKMSDKVIVFEDGEIHQHGSHEELIKETEQLYNKLFSAQSQYYLEL